MVHTKDVACAVPVKDASATQDLCTFPEITELSHKSLQERVDIDQLAPNVCEGIDIKTADSNSRYKRNANPRLYDHDHCVSNDT